VKKETTLDTDEEVDARIQQEREKQATEAEVEGRAVVEGDTVNLDYSGSVDGVAFAGGTAQGQSIELSENSGYIDGFADGLIGVTPGSTVDLTLTFPTDYHAADMAGKTVVFTVTVHYIQGEQITPELTDAFVTEFTGGDYTTVEAFRTFYRNYLDAAAAEKAHANALNTLWSAVFENTTFHQVPTEQVSYYHAQLKAQYESYAASYGMSYETILSLYGLTDESLKTQAEQYAKQDLVFYAIVKAESITVTEEEYTAGLADYAASSGVSSAEMEAYYGKDYIMESLVCDSGDF
jgi:trigger factor